METEEVHKTGEEASVALPQKPKKSWRRRVCKWAMLVLLSLLLGIGLLYALLQISAVQQQLLRWAVAELSHKTKTKVSIGKIDLSLFRSVVLQDVFIADQRQDTLLFAKQLDAEVDLWQLLNNKLVINGIGLHHFYANIYRTNEQSDYNYQFLVDAFSSADTVQDTQPSKLVISIKDIRLRGGRLHFQTLSAQETPRVFNASRVRLHDVEADIALPYLLSYQMDVEVKHLKATDVSGLCLQDLSLRLSRRGADFALKEVKLHLDNSTIYIPLANYNFWNKQGEVALERIKLSPLDLSYFLPIAKNLKDDITLEGRVRTHFPQVELDSLLLSYSSGMHAAIDAQIEDVTAYHKSPLSINVRRLKVNQQALQDFASLASNSQPLPTQAKALGDIHLRATASGTLQQLAIDAETWTAKGAVQTKAKLSADSLLENISLTADVQTQNFDLSFVGIQGLGRLSAMANIKYEQTPKQPLLVEAKGLVHSLMYDGKKVQDVRFSAAYTPDFMKADLQGDTPFGSLAANFSSQGGKQPVYKFSGDVKNLVINTFYKNENWGNPLLTTSFEGDISGSDGVGFSGYAQLKDLTVSDADKVFSLGDIRFDAGKSESGEDFMSINSLVANARIDGKIRLSTLMDEACNIAYRYMPQFVYASRKKTTYNNFRLEAQLKDVSQISQLLALPLQLPKPMLIEGEVSTHTKTISLSGKVPELNYGEGKVRNAVFDLSAAGEQMQMNVHSFYTLKDNKMELELNANADSDTIRTQITYTNDADDLSVGGQVDSYFFFDRNKKKQLVSHLHILPSMIYINDLRFMLTEANLTNENGRTHVSGLGMKYENKDYLQINGVASASAEDVLHINFIKAPIAQLLAAFNIQETNATLDGDWEIASATGQPQIATTDFLVKDIVLQGDTLGTVQLNSKWDESREAVLVEALLQRDKRDLAQVDGHVFTKGDLGLDINVAMNKMPLAWMLPFAKGTLNRLKGELASQVNVKGSLSNPDINGWLGISDGEFGIDYTNVTYRVSDTIRVARNKIGFNNLQVTDPSGNKGYLDAEVMHDGFANFRYKLNARISNFMVMNTEHRTDSLFYGKVYATGTVAVQGDAQEMDVTMNVQNGRNSNFTMVVPQTETAMQYNGIVYINTPKDTASVKDESVPEIATANDMAIRVKGQMKFTDQLKLNILLEQSSGNTSIHATGNGTVDFTYDGLTGGSRVLGSYHLSKGDVNIGLQRISNMNFEIGEGSKLTFKDDPMQTAFDITAYKQLRASLSSLDESFATDQNLTSTRVDVQCMLGIQGDMNQMSLRYDVLLPNVSDDVRKKVKALIATDEQKTQQFAYLMFVGSFYNNAGNNSPATNSVVTSVASGALNKTLDAVFGKMLGDKWNIDTSLTGSDGTTNGMDVDVNVSTKLFDDRMQVKTNLGYRSASTQTGAEESFVGNVDVEYALSKSLKMRVYNKQNDKYYQQASTIQGVGVVYTRESKRFSELLFGLFRKRKPVPSAKQGKSQ